MAATGAMLAIRAAGRPGFGDREVDPSAFEDTRHELTGPGGCGPRIDYPSEVVLEGNSVDPFSQLSASGPRATASPDWELVPRDVRGEKFRRVRC